MSYANFAPPPVPYSQLAPGDLDKSPVLDATTAMGVRGTTITALGTPVVSRTDGAALTSADLTVLSPAILTGALQIAWQFQAGTNTAAYLVEFPLTLSDGSDLHRTVTVSVVPNVG